MKITVNWLTIISFGFNLVLSGLGLYQFLDAQKQQTNTETMVRNWQNQAEGLHNGLLSISQNPDTFSGTTDMAKAVEVAGEAAYALHSALYQQRFYTDNEVKTQKENSAAKYEKLMEELKEKEQLN